MAQTPVGIFKYCHLNKPDTKFSEVGDFSVTVVFDADEEPVKRMLSALKKAHAKAVEEAEEKWDEISVPNKKKLANKGITGVIALPFYEDEYDENDQPTGNIMLRFKTKAQFKDRKTGRMSEKVVTFVDGKGQVIPAKKRPLVYGGTTGRVDFSNSAYFIPAQGTAGLSLYLNKVQIAQLVSAGGGGFDEIEGSGFSADDLEEYEGSGGDSSGGSTGGGIDDDLDGDLGGSGQDTGGPSDFDDEIPF